MRKLSLLAAAAMVAGGSAFAMDGGGVSISGEANFGVKYNEANDVPGKNALAFHHEFDIKFSASGTTDGGIGFGGSVSIDNTESVSVGKKGAKAATAVKRITAGMTGTAFRENTTRTDSRTAIGTNHTSAYIVQAPENDTTIYVELDSKGLIEAVYVDEGRTDETDSTVYKLELPAERTGNGADATDYHVIAVVDGKPTLVKAEDIGGEGDLWAIEVTDGTLAVYKVGTGVGPMNAATAASFDPDASNKIDNHGEVYISMDMHKLTIGSDIDAADKVAGGLADPGFDGIGIDDVAEGPYGGSAADVRYDGDFGVASVAMSYGDNKGDAEWAAGFSFNVDPVTFGAGFDSKGVMSIGMGFMQGQISMNALYSTDSDHDEADNEAVTDKTKATATTARGGTAGNPARTAKPDLKNQAIGVDMTYQMTDTTSLVIVAAQHKKESADWHYVLGDTTTDFTKTDSTKWVKSSTTVDAFGVGFSHDLGGGATLKAGAGSVDSNAVADLGITMKF